MVKSSIQVSMDNLPGSIRSLLKDREKARQAKDFAQSDMLRHQIAAAGYLVNDNATGFEIHKIGDSTKKAAKSYLVLFGSGENAPGSVAIYRDLFLTFGKKDLKISLLTTPAGFQPNVAAVYQEIKDFLTTSLPDFNLAINIVFANTRVEANDPTIVAQIEDADIIFTGPGSPTYAAKHLQHSMLSEKIIDKVKNGSTLILASAATIAFSEHALPVYEIYKVGDELHWAEGLDLFREIWESVTVIPHYNNAEGGAGLDTSHCYVGHDRFEKLRKLLPPETKYLAIDEHTAYIVDLATQSATIKGKGSARTI